MQPSPVAGPGHRARAGESQHAGTAGQGSLEGHMHIVEGVDRRREELSRAGELLGRNRGGFRVAGQAEHGSLDRPLPLVDVDHETGEVLSPPGIAVGVEPRPAAERHDLTAAVRQGHDGLAAAPVEAEDETAAQEATPAAAPARSAVAIETGTPASASRRLCATSSCRSEMTLVPAVSAVTR